MAKDQAETLRKLMKEGEVLVTSHSRRKARVVCVGSAQPHAGKSWWIEQMTTILTETGSKVLKTESRRPSSKELADADFVFIEALAGFNSGVSNVYRPADDTVIVVSPDESALQESGRMMSTLRRKVMLNNFEVIVNHVTNANEARSAYKKLNDLMAHYRDLQLDYLGHFNTDEKNIQSVMKNKILLNLYSRTANSPPVQEMGVSRTCLEIMAKRLITRHLGPWIKG